MIKIKKAYLKYITALFLFGSNGTVASRIGIGSTYIVLYRTFLGSLLLLMLYFLTGNRFSFHKKKKDFAFVTVSGVAMGASWMLLYEAYDRIGVGVSSLLYYTGPIAVMMLSPIVFNEKLTAKKLIGFSAVLAGIAAVNGINTGALDAAGVAMGLMSALMYAAMVMANKKSVALKGAENSLIQLTVAFLTTAVFTVCKNGFVFPAVNGEETVWLLILGLVNTGVGCYLYFSSIGELEVQSVAVLGYTEPLSAVLFSAAFLGEKMTGLQIVGAVLIIGGAAFANIGKSKKTGT